MRPAFWQHIALDQNLEVPYPHGTWYGNKDFIKYFYGTKVVAHVDAKKLNDPRFKHFGPFIAFKLGLNGEDQMLCSVSNKTTGCEWNRSKQEDDPDFGGHVLLPPGTIYWMFDEGAFGGISHSIYNSEGHHHLWNPDLFGGYKSKSFTLVM